MKYDFTSIMSAMATLDCRTMMGLAAAVQPPISPWTALT